MYLKPLIEPEAAELISPRLSRALRRAPLYAFLIAVLLAQLFPLLWLFGFSLKSNAEIFGGNVLGLPESWLWANYRQVLAKGDLMLYFWNSLVVSVASVSIVIGFGSMAAYAIARLRWRLSKATLLFFLLGLMIPDRKSVV